ncbi:Recombination protein RecR [Piscirickettsia salmonis]|uniref:Recombination protein RecR n=1 Tax=Piscirickettsia salmonis TaxID=1238 RepID=A0A1L6TAV1_PISSA|nr:recombination mediator RecR [Piscirickettsia salmonis]AKP73629.1 recombination protein RecR [Piscirickettsia salmonis LF-89 = ATCC VR-1361]ALB22407.1 recombination protein RecR [Piscirickettsia salmonis]ALY02481.1 recombination protein RecR [Piscirickettsia salmonis]AMA42000.1 recombination protein RecR [Piscirickettsia salmonis]AOS34472.1 recombination protein RecR [Piscirickettsia salmonis]
MADKIQQLVQAFKCLPGVGTKGAQRMAYHLLERGRQQAEHLGKTLLEAVNEVQHCQKCRTLCMESVCTVCNDSRRDQGLLCIVESPMDQRAIEQMGMYRGCYFVLLGRLSPLDGLGPDEIGLMALEQRVQEGVINEVVLATSSTVEGEATAHFIADQLKGACKVTRIAHGVPFGGELEFVNSVTLSHAFELRREFNYS